MSNFRPNPFSLGDDEKINNNIMEYSTAGIIPKGTGYNQKDIQEYLFKVASDPVGTPDFGTFMNEINPQQKFVKENRFKQYETDVDMENELMKGTQAKELVDIKTKQNKDAVRHFKD